MMRFLWLCSMVCALAASSPFHSSISFAQNDEDVVDFDEATLNEDDLENEMDDEDTTKTADSKSATADEDDDFEDEFKDDDVVEDKKPAPKVADKKEEPAAGDDELIEPLDPDDTKAEAEEPIVPEPAPEVTEPEPQVAEPTPAPEPTPEPTPQVVQNNDPDLEYEARLYDIYVNYTSAKTPEDQWRGLVGQRQDERYKIQKNDTLWDISRTLFGDGNYWPKIWSLNSAITNPHIIEPGNTIRFLLGDESGPPAFTVSENEAETETGAGATMSPQARNDESGNGDEPDIPPPSRRYTPVLKNIPPSLPNWQDPDADGAQFDAAGISYGRRKIADLKDAIPLAAYITSTAPRPLGSVTEIETGFNLASALQYIYVRMMPGEGEVGDTYLSVINRGAVKANKNVVTQEFLGYGIEVLGEVQLIEKVKSEKLEKQGEVYRALVTKTVSPVQTGSSLIIGKIEGVDLSDKGPKVQTVAQIIGGQFSAERKIYGPQSFAFLNRGMEDGISVGQVLPIRSNRKARDPKSAVLANIRSIGWLKIVKADERFSTAVILRAWEEIVTGDYTGSGDGINIARDMNQPELGAKATLLDELGDEGPVSKAAPADDSFGDDADLEDGSDANFEDSGDDMSDEIDE